MSNADKLDKLLEIISVWPPMGQGVFFAFTMVLVVFAVWFVPRTLFFHIVALFRGWPPVPPVEGPNQNQQRR